LIFFVYGGEAKTLLADKVKCFVLNKTTIVIVVTKKSFLFYIVKSRTKGTQRNK